MIFIYFIQYFTLLITFLFIILSLRPFNDYYQIEEAFKQVICGSVFIIWGITIIISYFFPKKGFLFKGITWICCNFSNPRDSGMAFVYGSLALICGIIYIVVGLLKIK